MVPAVQPEASIVQTGTDLRYIGDHCYAYSGTFGSTTSAETAFDFTSGSGFIVGKFQLNLPTTFGTHATQIGYIQIKLNGEIIAILTVGFVDADSDTWATQEIIIPPNTRVNVEIVADDNQSARLMATTFVGRVYGTE
jgi:hypothetical protein